jgi:tripartite-type tricarboxylate transporter receptor subunit TctC
VTPADMTAELEKALREVMTDPAMQATISSRGLIPAFRSGRQLPTRSPSKPTARAACFAKPAHWSGDTEVKLLRATDHW